MQSNKVKSLLANNDVELMPHTWTLATWERLAPKVYPFSEARGRRVLRQFQNELMQHGALTRVGREIVFLGRGYSRWLESQKHRVDDFEIACNATLEDTNDEEKIRQ